MEMDREQILQKFQNLNENVWERDGERAPHKPLLVLLAIGKLLRGEGRLISYTNIEEGLKDLLKEFGPWRKTYHPEQPFWRLRNAKDEKDIVWEIPNSHKIQEGKRKNGKSTGNPIIGDLRCYGKGRFLQPIADQLQNDFGLTFEVIGQLLASHFPVTYHEDILQAVGIELSFGIPNQPRDPKFRQNILEAYNYRCAICGFNVTLRDRPIALEAAHIKWRMAEGPDKEGNGIALCSLHHKLFDRGAFTLSDQLLVRVSEHVDKTSVGFEEWLRQFDGQEINFPPRERIYYPNEDFTGWHLKEVFKGKYSE